MRDNVPTMPRSIPLLPFFLSFLCALSPLATYIHTYGIPTLCALFLWLFYTLLFFSLFFFCFRCRDRFRTVIGSISLNPPTPANARDQRWAQFSSPTPPPLAYPLYSSLLRCFDYLLGPDCVFFSRDGLSSTCLSVCPPVCVRVSVFLTILFFLLSLPFRFSSSLFPPTECICTKCRGSAHNIAFGLFSPYYFCISYIDQKGAFLPPFEYNFLAFPLLNDRTLYPTCLLFSHIAHI